MILAAAIALTSVSGPFVQSIQAESFAGTIVSAEASAKSEKEETKEAESAAKAEKEATKTETATKSEKAATKATESATKQEKAETKKEHSATKAESGESSSSETKAAETRKTDEKSDNGTAAPTETTKASAETSTAAVTTAAPESSAESEEKLVSRLDVSLTDKQKKTYGISRLQIEMKDSAAVLPENAKLVIKTVGKEDTKAILSDTGLDQDENRQFRFLELGLETADGKEIALKDHTAIVTITYHDVDTTDIDTESFEYYRFLEKDGKWSGKSLAGTKNQNDGKSNDITVSRPDDRKLADVTAEFETNRLSAFALTWNTAAQEPTKDAAETVNYTADAGDQYTVTVTAPAGALPEGTVLVASAIDETTAEYAQTKEALQSDKGMDDEKAFDEKYGFAALDIHFEADGKEVEPTAEVTVNIQMKQLSQDLTDKQKAETLTVEHLTDDGVQTVADTNADSSVAGTVQVQDGSTVDAHFTVSTFSTFVVTWNKTLTTTLTASDGNTYKITVTYGEDAGIPDGTKLRATEITDEEQIAGYTARAAAAMDGQEIRASRFFDISFICQDQEIEPEAPVSVNITFLDQGLPTEDEGSVAAVHFAENASEGNDSTESDRTAAGSTEVIHPDVSKDDAGNVKTVDFTQSSFSVTGVVVTGDKLNDDGWPKENGDYVVLITYENNYYALKNDGTLMQVTVSDGKANFASTITNMDNLKDYLWHSDNGEKTLSNSSGSGTVYIDPFGSNCISSTKPAAGESYTTTYPGQQYRIETTTALQIDSSGRLYQACRVYYYYHGSWRYYYSTNYYLAANRSGSSLAVGYTNDYSEAVPVTFVTGFAVDDTRPGQDPGRPVEPDAPTATKALSDNSDGTYDLSLSVKGQATSSSKKTKADVIVILDRSGSMTENRVSGGITRLQAAKNAIGALTDSLMANNTEDASDTVRMALITFGNSSEYTQDWTTSANTFKSTVNGLGEQKNVGTNWEAALQRANTIPTRSGAEKYVIFVSDGNPTFYVNGDRIGGSGQETSNNVAISYFFAKDDAYSLVQNGYSFYSLMVFGNATRMQNLTRYAYSGRDDGTYPSGHYQEAEDQSALISAFQNIINEITHNLGYQNVTVTDGLTALTATTLVNGDIGDFQYTVKDASGNAVEVTENSDNTYSYSNGAETKIFKGAEYSEGKVTWNMDVNASTPFVLDNRYTYTVSFTVWPSQAAYDIVADLQNGTITWDPNADYAGQITRTENSDGTYSYGLKTNTDGTSVSYTPVTTTTDSNGNTTTITGTPGSSEISNPTPVALTGTSITLKKVWDDNADTSHRPESITLNLIRDKGTENEEKTPITIQPAGDSNEWTATVHIAPGLIAGGKTLEQGHTYDIEEPTPDRHYELETHTYHPMLIDSAADIYDVTASGNEKITSLVATNELRGSIQLEKKVQDADGTDITSISSGTADSVINPAIKDETFTFTMTLVSPGDHTEKTANGLSSDYWYTFLNQDHYHESITDELYSHAINDTGQGTAVVTDANISYDDGTNQTTVTAVITLKPHEKFCMIDVPIGTLYTFSESPKDGYTLVGTVINNTVVTGTVSSTTAADQNDQVVFTNRLSRVLINLTKTGADSKPLSGAEFTLHRMENGKRVQAYRVTGEEIGTISMADAGSVSIGELPDGTYQLEETKAPSGYVLLPHPVEFTVNRAAEGPDAVVSLTQAGDNNSNAKANVTISADSEFERTASITVSNDQIYELPSTGGSGIYWYTIIGTMMAMLSAYAGFSMKRGKERRRSG